LVAKTLAKDPDFIKAGFHFGRFVTATVDTKVDRYNTEVLQTELDSAWTRINVSTPFITVHYHLCSILTSLFDQKIIEHSSSKDKFLRVAIKRLTKTHLFEDELKQVKDLNDNIVACN
jgi:hypothetical protein